MSKETLALILFLLALVAGGAYYHHSRQHGVYDDDNVEEVEACYGKHCAKTYAVTYSNGMKCIVLLGNNDMIVCNNHR